MTRKKCRGRLEGEPCPHWVFIKGLCQLHYMRAWSGGTLERSYQGDRLPEIKTERTPLQLLAIEQISEEVRRHHALSDCAWIGGEE